MDRSLSISIWKATRSNVGLPPPPDDMSEPSFADLVFVGYCHVRSIYDHFDPTPDLLVDLWLFDATKRKHLMGGTNTFVWWMSYENVSSLSLS
jgi:hypothetical protein